MLIAILLLQTAVSAADPFAFFQPTVRVSASQVQILERGDPVTQILPASGREDAVFTAMPVAIDNNRLIAWIRRIEELKKGKYVLAIGRFSNPPRIEDLAALELDHNDIEDIQKCRRGSCQLKLSAAEMAQLRRAGRPTNDDTAGGTIQDAFRHVILERVQLYIKSGQIPAYEDGHVPVQPEARFAALLQHTAFLTTHVPDLAEYLRNYPRKSMDGVESFFYWSKEQVVGKAIISVTQVNIVRYQEAGVPEVLVVNRDIYSSHYVDASLSVTALVQGPPDQSNFLVYMNRTEVDILHGMFEGFIRKAMHHRVKDDSVDQLQAYKERLESGDPPPENPTSARRLNGSAP